MRYLISLLLLTVVVTSGCTVNPVTGKSEFTLMSEQEEIAIGEQNYQPSIQAQGGEYAVDPGLSAYVNSVGQKLAAVSHNKDLPYEFTVLNNDVPNAWALPGGKIAFNRGLLVLLKDESQLAAVIGHEIVHATARHSANQMTQGAILGTGAQVLGVAVGDTFGGLVAQGAGISVQAWQARYGRGNELQADEVGMEYMSKVGYDPQGAVELQQTFVSLSENEQTASYLDSFFASHPPSEERVKANQKEAKKLSGTLRNQAEFEKATAQLRKDAEAYRIHVQAKTALQNNELDKALELTNKAIAIEPKENLFWETKAHIYVTQKNPQEALKAYDKAVDANPSYFSSRLGRGMVRAQTGNLDGAEQDLLESKKLLDTPNASYLLGQVMLAKNDKAQATTYFQQAAAAGGEVGQAAQQQLDKINSGQ